MVYCCIFQKIFRLYKNIKCKVRMLSKHPVEGKLTMITVINLTDKNMSFFTSHCCLRITVERTPD